jgi:hypothetical protein
LIFRHFALGAAEFGAAGSGGHTTNLALSGETGNMPLVTSICDHQSTISNFFPRNARAL